MDLVSLVTTPISLWLQAITTLFYLPLNLTCTAATWTMAFISLPARICTALIHHQTLQRNLIQMQIHLDTLACQTKELEHQLRASITDRNLMEIMFEEIEDEHAKALSTIHQLQTQLQDLKEENTRLNEICGKVQLDYEAHGGRDGGYVHQGIPLASANYVIPSWDTGYKNTTPVMLGDILMPGDPWGKGVKGKLEEQSLLEVDAGSCKIPSQHVVDEALKRTRSIALEQSLFSTILSLLVGMIIWQAEDPCMPLVAALFIVVGMSLSSVVQFFSTIKNKPASDAVALLSLNWFVLGTLTSPSLPSITQVLAPRVIKVIGRLATWLG